jgi:hypothetical protein
VNEPKIVRVPGVSSLPSNLDLSEMTAISADLNSMFPILPWVDYFCGFSSHRLMPYSLKNE